jgi:3-hydroxyisobutyrate dehydrogenase
MEGVGLVGVGNMGAAMWRRLHDLGTTATVVDVRPDVTAALAADGAPVATDTAQLAAACTVILLSLPTSTQVADVALGPGGIRETAAPGTLLADLTSGVPTESRRIAAALADAGIRYVDAGVSGGVEGARAGALKVMIGGSEADVVDARAVLDDLAATVWHCGPVGSGHTVKTLLNLSNQAKLMIELEALLVAAAAGIDPTLTGQVLDLAVWNRWLLAPEGRRRFGFSLALACKDFDIALRTAAEHGVAAPLAAVAQQVLRLASASAGDGADLIDSVAVWETLAGVELGGEEAR